MTLDETDKIIKQIEELMKYTTEDAEFESIIGMFEDNFIIREKVREWYNLLISESIKFYEEKGT